MNLLQKISSSITSKFCKLIEKLSFLKKLVYLSKFRDIFLSIIFLLIFDYPKIGCILLVCSIFKAFFYTYFFRNITNFLIFIASICILFSAINILKSTNYKNLLSLYGIVKHLRNQSFMTIAMFVISTISSAFSIFNSVNSYINYEPEKYNYDILSQNYDKSKNVDVENKILPSIFQFLQSLCFNNFNISLAICVYNILDGLHAPDIHKSFDFFPNLIFRVCWDIFCIFNSINEFFNTNKVTI